VAAERPPGAILLDANLLLWAHHAGFARHEAARGWLATALTESSWVGIPWASILAFLRISTHPRALSRPLSIDTAWEVVHGWLDRPNVRPVGPGEGHATILGPLLIEAHAGGNHTTDAHLAALALEWGLELLSADRDFARYPRLRWRDPLADP
jgi:toxin-antitoxin system PIN domain toxin